MAKRTPKGLDGVMDDVYERMKIKNAASNFVKKVATHMVTKEEISTRLGTARREGEERGEAKANKKFAARMAKMAKFLKSNGVSAKLLNAALAIK